VSSAANGDRFELDLVRPRASVNPGVRPTVVLAGRGQPAQWGVGTWQRTDGVTTISVYLFNRVWRYGEATATLGSTTTRVVYRAPRLPFGRGRIELIEDPSA
jgi:hypothetical protein